MTGPYKGRRPSLIQTSPPPTPLPELAARQIVRFRVVYDDVWKVNRVFAFVTRPDLIHTWPHKPFIGSPNRNWGSCIPGYFTETPGSSITRSGRYVYDQKAGAVQAEKWRFVPFCFYKLSLISGWILAWGQETLWAHRHWVPELRVSQVLQLRQRNKKLRGKECLQTWKVTHAPLWYLPNHRSDH